jgi:peroxiredoxin
MRKLFLVLPVSSVVIFALVAWKLSQPTGPQVERGYQAHPAVGAFQVHDEHSRIVRSGAYLGRHRMLIVFFDAAQAGEPNGLLQRVRAAYARLHETKAIVWAISARRPAELREIAERYGPFPFPLLSDVVDHQARRQFGLLDPAAEFQPEAVVVVDRAGRVGSIFSGPDGLGETGDWVSALNTGR